MRPSRWTSLPWRLLDGLPDAVVLTSDTDAVEYANRTAELLFDIPLGDLVGCDLSVLFDRSTSAADEAEGERPGTAGAGELVWCRRRDGSRFPADWIASTTSLADGSVVRVHSVREATERYRLQQERCRMEGELREVQRLESLSRLASGLAHDFNNLLTGILGHISLIRAECDANPSLEDHLEPMEASARHAADLCKQLLAFSGRGGTRTEAADLNELVVDAIQLVQPSWNRLARLELNLCDAPVPLVVNPTQIRQTLINLLFNASEAVTGRDGRILVTTERFHGTPEGASGVVGTAATSSRDYALLRIRDNGVGMDEATRFRSLEPFFSTKSGGRGLGLAAASGIVRGHRGVLTIASEAGGGTEVAVYLPAQEGAFTARRAARPDEAPASRPAQEGTARVLVVDDEEIVRRTAARMLLSLGYEVEEAADGKVALEIFRSAPERFDLVLLDLTMPNLSGQATALEMRRTRQDVPILLMSGYSGPVDTEESNLFEALAAPFLNKPFTRDELGRVVLAVLEERGGPTG